MPVAPFNPAGRQAEDGFTILELMVASAVFAVVMLVIAIGVIRTTDAYFSGITSSKTQTTARAIVNELSQDIELSKTVIPIAPNASGLGGVCIDNNVFAYQLGQEVTDTNVGSSPHQAHQGLLVASGVNCSAGIPATIAAALASPGPITPPSGSRELLGEHMRISAFSVVNGGGNLWTVHVRIVYGDDSLLSLPFSLTNLPNEYCTIATGYQFCAVSNLTTTVEQRLN